MNSRAGVTFGMKFKNINPAWQNIYCPLIYAPLQIVLLFVLKQETFGALKIIFYRKARNLFSSGRFPQYRLIFAGLFKATIVQKVFPRRN